MESVFSSFSGVITIFVYAIIGYVLQKKGIINSIIGKFISVFVVNVLLPCNICKTIITSFSLSQLTTVPFYTIFIICSLMITLNISILVCKLLKVKKELIGLVTNAITFSNTLFIGLPLNNAFFGDATTAIVLCYYLASMMIFWSVGIRIMGKNTNSIRQLCIPIPIYGLLVGVIILLASEMIKNFVFPSFLLDILSGLGNMTTPLSMIFTGYAIAEYGIKNIRINKDVIIGLFGRFLISPMVILILLSVVDIPTIEKKSLILQSLMPVMASQTIIARKYGLNDEYPAVVVTLSTLLSVIIIPILGVFLL